MGHWIITLQQNKYKHFIYIFKNNSYTIIIINYTPQVHLERGVILLLLLWNIASKGDDDSWCGIIFATFVSVMVRNVMKLIDAYVLARMITSLIL